ncbi:membrane protein [Streptomyces showdoensis]|uniref:Membrane protein n=1 Tax=Streptomyces showdoensis TaxID=68268 RepID=A0A2P2GD89_STREW|nr:rhomboid-like protein [Streptomyces showdoensis]KKZ69461.1 membrane protein [Streptomyces showdoensis]
MPRETPSHAPGGEPSRPIRSWVRSSPGTHVWLAVIAITSLCIALSPDGLDHYLLHRNSSNLYELSRHPMQALLGSAFWIENPASLLLYAVLFEVFHAPVERWLGTVKWLVVVATAHIAATLISQKVVLEAIQDHDVPRSMAHVVDIGVSYGLAASVGILTYRLPRPWRWFYLAGAVAFFAVPLVTNHTYTDLGHAISLLIGLAFWPLTRHVPDKPVVHAGASDPH